MTIWTQSPDVEFVLAKLPSFRCICVTGGITTDSPVVADTEQLVTSYNTEESNDKSDYPGMFVVKPPSDNVEAAENSISPLQNDGLKLVIPPNVGSLIIDNSQMNQELDVTVQTSNSGNHNLHIC